MSSIYAAVFIILDPTFMCVFSNSARLKGVNTDARKA